MKLWTAAELRRLAAEVGRGGSVDWIEIARRFGRSERSVHAQAERLGLHEVVLVPDAMPGVRCACCGVFVAWPDSESLEALAEVIKQAKAEHSTCRKKRKFAHGGRAPAHCFR